MMSRLVVSVVLAQMKLFHGEYNEDRNLHMKHAQHNNENLRNGGNDGDHRVSDA
jgi:hypothetical protein